MLVEFTFENLFSYKNESYFSMEAAKGTKIINEFPKVNQHRILKSAVIFGSNASGKSNLLNAMDLMKEIVLYSSRDEGLPFPSFANLKDDPITLSISIVTEGIVYRYTFSYTTECVLSEKLEFEEKGTFNTYFERQKEIYVVIPEDVKDLTTKTREDALFLLTAKTFNDQHGLNVFRWFRRSLLILNTNFVQSKDFADQILGRPEWEKLKDEKYKNAVLKFMKAADVSIEDIEMTEQTFRITDDEHFFKYPKRSSTFTKKRLLLKHRSYQRNGDRGEDYTLDFSQESEGTRKLLYLASIILLNEHKTILIDEFDKSLHLELSQALLGLFNSPENNNQFILTTHQINLMDFEFKKEQIYFVERKDDGISDLYSAYDFSMETNRKDYSYLKRYMDGQFGAIPIILLDTLKDTLKEMRER